jgi:hypothetical protein
LCRLGESSDSLDEEVVVTPSANQVAPQGRAKGTEKGRGKKRKLDMLKDGIRGEEIVIGVYEEDEEAESRMEEASRAERAKTVAMGWREKYALRPAVSDLPPLLDPWGKMGRIREKGADRNRLQ